MEDKAWPFEFPGTNWIDEQEETAVLDVLRTRSLFRYYGPTEPKHVAALEETARSYYGADYALGISGGTGGLITTLLALGVGPGDEVIIPSFLWVATVGAVVQCNAIPVLCEVDDSFNMDPEDLKRKITDHTKLIIVIHMAGAPCDMERIMQVARDADVDVIEDCAQCNGGSFSGIPVGTFGHAGIFSFQINKNATAGEGGLVITNDEELYWKLNAIHDVGVPWKNAAPAETDAVFGWGQGRRLSELAGAVANTQLKKLPDIVNHLRSSNRRIQSMLEGTPGVEFRRLNDPDGDTGPFLIIVLENDQAARRLQRHATEAGLKAVFRLADYGLHIYYNIPQLVAKAPLSPAGNPWSLPQNKGLVRDYAKGACPVSDDLFDRSVLVTIPSRLTHEQEDRITEVLKEGL
jgi:8-amino-3,8-dideoxy-alpha-D-manno-octulosonate transaminase